MEINDIDCQCHQVLKDLKCVVVVCRPSITIEFPRLIPHTSRVKRKNTAYEFSSRSRLLCLSSVVVTIEFPCAVPSRGWAGFPLFNAFDAERIINSI